MQQLRGAAKIDVYDDRYKDLFPALAPPAASRGTGRGQHGTGSGDRRAVAGRDEVAPRPNRMDRARRESEGPRLANLWAS